MKFLITRVLTSALFYATACGKPNAGDVECEPWTLRTESGRTIACERGTLYVPENRANPKSRVIGIGFLRIKAVRKTGAPPTIHLPGGPGMSFLDKLNANEPRERDRVINPGFEDDFAFYRGISDMIYFDQRGYSSLGDKLTYPRSPQPLAVEGSFSRYSKEFVDIAKRSVAHYEQKGFDLSGYNIKEYAADVNDLCKALRYDKVTLIGNSFGGQWAFATIRMFPGIVARALISSVEPLGCGYDIPSEVYAALKRQWASVGRDRRLPEDGSGVEGALRDILRRLPITVTVTVTPDPKESKRKTLRLGRDDLYLPAFDADMILAVYRGDYDLWARMVLRAREAPEPVALIGPLINVSLGGTAERRRQVRMDRAIEMVGRWDFEDYMLTEGIWPTVDVGDEFRTERRTETPVLFVQGAWDVPTPMENLKHVERHFVNSRTMIVTNGPHAAYVRARRKLPEVKNGVAEFLTSGNMARLPRTVTLPAAEESASPANPQATEILRYAR